MVTGEGTIAEGGSLTEALAVMLFRMVHLQVLITINFLLVSVIFFPVRVCLDFVALMDSLLRYF